MKLSKTRLNTYSRLNSRKQREKLGLFVAEGEKCVADTLPYFSVEAIIVLDSTKGYEETYGEYPIFQVSEAEMRSLSQFQSISDIMVVYKIPEARKIEGENFAEGLTLMLDSVQDPGNLGTILRIASWFGVARVVLSPGCADPYNPKAVQSSMGALGMIRILQSDLLPIMNKFPDIPVCGTLLDGSDIYTSTLSLPAFVVMGNEGNGLSKEIRSRVTLPLLIPSFAFGAHAESLNVAAATAITVSEFMRRTL